MSIQQNHSSDQTDYSEDALHDCAKAVVQAIHSLREEHDFEDKQPVSVYITDKPIIRRMLKTHRAYIIEQTNAADLVQINVDANIPMPAHAPQADYEIGGQTVRVAIDRD